MPSRSTPTPDDIQLPGIQAARPVAGIDVSPWGQGAQALAHGVSNLGQGVEKSADDLVQAQINLHTRTVDNALTDLSSSYLNNRNQFGFSNDPGAIGQWQQANQDARQRFDTAVQGVTPALLQHAQSRAGAMDAQEGIHLHSRWEDVSHDQARASISQFIDSAAATVSRFDDSPGGDVTRGQQIQGLNGRIDQYVQQSHLSASEAQQLRQQGVQRIGSSILMSMINDAQAEPDPVKREAMFARVGGVLDHTLRPKPGTVSTPAASGPASVPALISGAETGDASLGPRALGNISPDSRGTRSYGFLGLNSGSGSAGAFQREYGAQFGLTGPPGSSEFDAQWRGAATSQTDAFRAAQIKFFQDHILPTVSSELVGFGIPENVASDPRVQAYFADRKVQMNSVGLRGVTQAWAGANGDVPAFLRNMNGIDRANLSINFRSAIESGVYGPEGHETRLARRLNGALAIGGAPPQAVTTGGAPQAAPVLPAAMGIASGATYADAAGTLGVKVDDLLAANGVPLATRPDTPVPQDKPLTVPGQAAAQAPSNRAALNPGDEKLAQMLATFTTPEHRYYWERHIEAARHAADVGDAQRNAALVKQQKDFYTQNEGDFYDRIVNPARAAPVTVQELSEAYQAKRLDFTQYKALVGVLHQELKDGDTISSHFGSGYGALYSRINPKPNFGAPDDAFAPRDATGNPISTAPQPLTNADIYDAYINGTVTKEGRDDLVKSLKEFHDRPEDQGLHEAKDALFKNMHHELAKPEDDGMGGTTIRNVKGEYVYNQVIWQMNRDYPGWHEQNSGKSPYEFWNEENAKKYADRLYPERQRIQDNVTGGGGVASSAPATGGAGQTAPTTPPAAGAPPGPAGSAAGAPVAPQGADAQEWQRIMATRPRQADGTPVNAGDWGKYVGLLLDHPTPQKMAQFDEKAGSAGFSAAELMQRLKPDALAEVAGMTDLTPEETRLFAGMWRNGAASVTPIAHDGRIYLVPNSAYLSAPMRPATAIGGTPPQADLAAGAEAQGWDRFPSYATADEANARTDKMVAALPRTAAAAAPGVPPPAAAAPPADEAPEDRRRRFEAEHTADLAAARAKETEAATRAHAARQADAAAANEMAMRAYTWNESPEETSARLGREATSLQQQVSEQRTQQERHDLGPSSREFAALMGDSYQHRLDATRKLIAGDHDGATTDFERADLSEREATVKRAFGSTSAFAQAQLRRITQRRAELDAMTPVPQARK